MVEKRVNITMIIMSLIGGVIGFGLGEILINVYKYRLSSIVLMGLYFGILAFCIGTMCVVAEVINPRLNGLSWRNNYLKTSLKFLIPCTLVGLFIFAAFFQYLYEIGTQKFKKVNDLVFVIDTSSSMSKTDPNNERFTAAINLLDSMNKENRVSIFKFDDSAQKVLPMAEVSNETKKAAIEKLEEFKVPKGNTNMRDALEKAYEEIRVSSKQDRNSMVILLSDGGDTYDLNNKFQATIQPFKDKNISIYSIGMSNGNNFSMLKKISRESGGNYYNVKEVKDLNNVFNKIYKDREQRLLMDKRNGVYEASSVYMILRIAFIALLGGLIAASVSFVFDNKNLLKRFTLGGIVAGVIAGVIIEVGFMNLPWMGTVYRALADIIIALIFTLIPVNVHVKDYSRKSSYIENEGFNNDIKDVSSNMFKASSKNN